MKGSFLNVWAPACRTRPSAARAGTGMLTGTSASCHINHCRSYNIRVYLFLSTVRWGGSGGLRWSEDTGGLIHRDTAAVVTPPGRCRGPSGVPGLAPGGQKWLCKSSPGCRLRPGISRAQAPCWLKAQTFPPDRPPFKSWLCCPLALCPRAT